MPRIAAVTKAGSLYDASRAVYPVEMPFLDFAIVERNPNQRNEAIRLNKRQFHSYSPTLLVVAIAVLPNGQAYKVDGHTRVFAAQSGLLPELLRSTLQVMVYSVKTVEEAVALYNAYDSTAASKKAADTVQSGLSAANLKLVTPWMAAGKIGSALTMASKAWVQNNPGPIPFPQMTQIEKVALFRDEIGMVDALGPNDKRFVQGILAGAFLAFKKHGSAATDFFQAYNDTAGLENGPDRNAVRMLHEHLNALRQAGRIAGDGVADDQFANTLALFNRHLSRPSGFWSNRPAPVRPIDFVRT